MCHRLCKLRKDMQLSQKDIADFLNISQNDYCDCEIGRNKFSLEDLIELSKFYNTSIDYLLGLTDIKMPYVRK